jgi:hypothetical protein
MVSSLSSSVEPSEVLQENVDVESRLPLYTEVSSFPACLWSACKAVADARGNISVFFPLPGNDHPQTKVLFVDKNTAGCKIRQPFRQYADQGAGMTQMAKERPVPKLRRDLCVEPTENQMKWIWDMERMAREQIATDENHARWFRHAWSLTEVEHRWRSVVDVDSSSKPTFRTVVCFNENCEDHHTATNIKVWKETKGKRVLKGHGQGRDFVNKMQDAKQWLGGTARMVICPWRLFYHWGNNSFTFMWRVTHLEVTEADTISTENLSVAGDPFEL